VARLPRGPRLKAIAGNNKPYYLYHPSSHKVSTPLIKLGLSAYYSLDRIELEDKAMGWRSGIQAEIMEKSKGKCALCCCSLLDDEIKMELHHVQPIQFEGPRTRLNLKALCTECHISVSTAVKTKDLESIKNFEQFGILKNVSRTLEHT
jgi:5-methylcytosine-specific restriction endonuclease McrA